MKTLEEFIRRLQDDAVFEKEAQAFVTEDELMAFVRREGYDFTLEQLMEKFQHKTEPHAEAGETAPSPTAVKASPPRGPDETSVSQDPEILSPGERHAPSPENGSRHSIRQQPGEELQTPPRAMLPPEPQDGSPLAFSRGGGGRHRGFSPQRLKYSSAEEP
jgi:Nif11 domain